MEADQTDKGIQREPALRMTIYFSQAVMWWVSWDEGNSQNLAKKIKV